MKKSFFITFLLSVLSFLAYAQSMTVHVVVVDSNNDPMPGVTIQKVGSPYAVTTDIDGRATIVGEPSDVIKVTFPGFYSKEFVLGTSTKWTIKLIPVPDSFLVQNPSLYYSPHPLVECL